MIFYFSGTGNSKFLAEKTAEIQKQTLFSIPELLKEKRYQFDLAQDEIIGFVFPVHSWGVPPLVLDFISKLTLRQYNNHYLFFICSVGDDCALTENYFKKAIRKKNWTCHSGFSVIMPNNYIMMNIKLFDVEKSDVQKLKIDNAIERIISVNQTVTERKSNCFDCVKTGYARLKSYIIYPLFKLGLNYVTKDFHATDSCNGCGLCEKLCPISTIRVEGKPIWSKKCTQCLACIHYCPQKAIQYKNFTDKKGRYYFPTN